jgi:cobalamin biosynthesis protein CobD/CbiB
MTQNRFTRKTVKTKLLQGACLATLGVAIKAILSVQHWHTNETVGVSVASAMIIAAFVIAFSMDTDSNGDIKA